MKEDTLYHSEYSTTAVRYQFAGTAVYSIVLLYRITLQ